MNIKDLLPIGSIVILKDGEQPLMIMFLYHIHKET